MRPSVMGVLNVTPDSFSDGGRYLDFDAASPTASTWWRPGPTWSTSAASRAGPVPTPVPEAEELRRVVPVVEALAPHVRVSVDTVKPAVAEAAIAAGATLVNDVSASLWRRGRRRARGLGGHAHAGHAAHHAGTIRATATWWPRSAPSWWSGPTAARAAGVDEVWVDPGIGFGKTVAHNLALLRHLPELVWPSACRWWSAPAARASWASSAPARDATPLPVEDRLPGSLATATWAMLAGAAMVRVHDVAATVQAATLVGECRLSDGRPGRRRGRGAMTGESMTGAPMKGKWAAGIPPRNFTWVVQDQLAVSERPGGFAPNHRRVRRQEEIIWLRNQGFTRVVSLLPVAAQPGRLRRGVDGLVPLPARARAGTRARSCSTSTAISTSGCAPASGSSCTRRSSATG